MNYYKQIKNRIIDVETTIKVKDYSKNKVIVENYYEIGRLIVEAQGGEKRAKYGNKLIKEYSEMLIREVNKKYSERTLRSMRKIYLTFKDKFWKPLVSKLDWTHLLILSRINNNDELIYYASKCIKNNLSKRELETLIKNKGYGSLPENTVIKLREGNQLELRETITNPILIPNPNDIEIEKELTLQKLILENITSFLKWLGLGYTFVGSEYSIKIGDRNYIDKNIKKDKHNKTLGIILCQRNNRLIMEYCSNFNIIVREYLLV